MSDTVIKLNREISEPSLADLLNLYKKDTMLNLNCHAIAEIQSFNTTNQTATATINYKRTVFKIDPVTSLNVPVQENYPVLLDCPVIILGGGSAHLTFPIEPGDDCIVLFNDRDIDNWFQSGQTVPLATSRLHSFSDGLILVGINSLLDSLAGYDPTRAKLFNGTTGIGISSDKVIIYNAITTLNTLLQDLVTQINAITTSPAVIGVPSTISPASQAALSAVATQIAGLLE